MDFTLCSLFFSHMIINGVYQILGKITIDNFKVFCTLGLGNNILYTSMWCLRCWYFPVSQTLAKRYPLASYTYAMCTWSCKLCEGQKMGGLLHLYSHPSRTIIGG